jgi:hypothetical protein
MVALCRHLGFGKTFRLWLAENNIPEIAIHNQSYPFTNWKVYELHS